MEEVLNVKTMKRFLYAFQAKACREKLSKQVDSVQFYLNSLHFSNTADISKLLCDDWSRAVKDNAGLLQQLEEERQQALELRRQIDA